MNNLLQKSCCITGHRAENLHLKEDKAAYLLYEAVNNAVKEGYDTFYFGGCTGADIIAAEQVLLRRIIIQQDDPSHINLIAIIPYEEQANEFTLYWHERYYNVLKRCDEVITLYAKFKKKCFEERNRYMVEHSSRLIAVYDGVSEGGTKQMIEYAKFMNLKIDIV